jgi:hypothetical protein
MSALASGLGLLVRISNPSKQYTFYGYMLLTSSSSSFIYMSKSITGSKTRIRTIVKYNIENNKT